MGCGDEWGAAEPAAVAKGPPVQGSSCHTLLLCSALATVPVGVLACWRNRMACPRRMLQGQGAGAAALPGGAGAGGPGLAGGGPCGERGRGSISSRQRELAAQPSLPSTCCPSRALAYSQPCPWPCPAPPRPARRPRSSGCGASPALRCPASPAAASSSYRPAAAHPCSCTRRSRCCRLSCSSSCRAGWARRWRPRRPLPRPAPGIRSLAARRPRDRLGFPSWQGANGASVFACLDWELLAHVAADCIADHRNDLHPLTDGPTPGAAARCRVRRNSSLYLVSSLIHFKKFILVWG